MTRVRVRPPGGIDAFGLPSQPARSRLKQRTAAVEETRMTKDQTAAHFERRLRQQERRAHRKPFRLPNGSCIVCSGAFEEVGLSTAPQNFDQRPSNL
jgi:hypothetical protein